MLIKLLVDLETLSVESSDSTVTVNRVEVTSGTMEIEISKPDESLPVAMNSTPIIQQGNS
jgi:hypothetical protein